MRTYQLAKTGREHTCSLDNPASFDRFRMSALALAAQLEKLGASAQEFEACLDAPVPSIYHADDGAFAVKRCI